MLNLSHISTALGQSAAAKRDYILRVGQYANGHAEVVHSGHAHLPDFARDDPGSFWEAADDHERKNARLASELRVALPQDLNDEQRVALVRAFVGERLDQQPCLWAIHRGKGKNPHAHLVYSERSNHPEKQYGCERYFKQNGARKNRSLKSKDWLATTRKVWSSLSNEHLALAGSLERIDHRRLSAQCVDHVEAIEQELQKAERGDAEVVDLRLDAARSLDRDPQEKRRWLRPTESGRGCFLGEGSGSKRLGPALVAYKRCKYRPERPQSRLLRAIEARVREWKDNVLAIAIRAAEVVLHIPAKPAAISALSGQGSVAGDLRRGLLRSLERQTQDNREKPVRRVQQDRGGLDLD